MVIQLNPEPEEQKESVLADFPSNEQLIITRVERQKKADHRYIIHFGQYNMTVHEDVMIKYRMITGSSFMKEELQEVIVADERQRAYVEALRYLGLKPRTAEEIARRLRQKEIGETIIAEVLQRLEQERLVDDSLYARQWAEQRLMNQKKGKLWIRQELRDKGVDKSLISEALENITPEQELESALQTGRKKWNALRGEAREKYNKTGAFLMRRGYPGELVRRVLNQLIQEENAESDEEEFYFSD
ncbi:regulatory protein RecX [Paenibacillus tengchongensis]|uniref:regulatory protein RecX n=1 Tax=Paenibacillus tengchongensis TaxID=2608684 RepID=UPI00124CADFF|nr:RecX family transcriptional regulator [Paenibacillus tengchongensis]